MKNNSLTLTEYSWYKIVLNDDSELKFKLLHQLTDGTGKIKVEYCDGNVETISIPMFKKFISLGTTSPCGSRPQ